MKGTIVIYIYTWQLITDFEEKFTKTALGITWGKKVVNTQLMLASVSFPPFCA